MRGPGVESPCVPASYLTPVKIHPCRLPRSPGKAPRRSTPRTSSRSCATRSSLPDGVVYLDGNSLGALPRATAARVRDVVEREWGESLIRSWNAHGWIDLPARVAALLAPLVGAAADEVAVADSTSVNLFKLLAGALRLRPGRRVILSEEENFPTDLYVAQGLASLLEGVTLRLVPRADLAQALDAERGRADADPRRLPDGCAPRHGGADPRSPPQRRARALGSRAQCRRAARGPRRMRGRPRRGLRLQVPERRSGRARVRIRRAVPPRRVRDAAHGLDGPRRAVRVRSALQARGRDRAAAVRHAAGPEPGRARVRGGDDRAAPVSRACAASRWP